MNRQKVLDALDKLGGTPLEVRNNLLGLGCKGDRGRAGSCPVARYLKKTVFSDSKDDLVVTCLDLRLGMDFMMGMPPVVGRFMNWFDGGDYPELEA